MFFQISHKANSVAEATDLYQPSKSGNYKAAIGGPLHAACRRDTCRLDLRAGDPCAFEDLQAVVAEVELVIARCEARARSALHLSVLCAFWH